MVRVNVTRNKASKASNASNALKEVDASPKKGGKKPVKALPPLRSSSRIQKSKVLESTSGGEEEDEEVEEEQDFSTDGDSHYESGDESSSVSSGKLRKKKGDVTKEKTTSRTPLQAVLSKHLDGRYTKYLHIYFNLQSVDSNTN